MRDSNCVPLTIWMRVRAALQAFVTPREQPRDERYTELLRRFDRLIAENRKLDEFAREAMHELGLIHSPLCAKHASEDKLLETWRAHKAAKETVPA